jgi:hypothetical protein
MKILLTAVSSIVAVALASPGRPQTATAALASTACPETSTSPSCGSEQSAEPAPDLSPTQWLFGRDAFAKLTQVEQGAWTGHRLRSPNVELASSDAGGGQSTRTAPTSERRAAPIGDTGSNTMTPGQSTTASAEPATDRGTQRYLIEEWRAAELAIADSVYDSNLEHIFQVFQVVERGRVAEPQRQQVLVRLDRMNQANQYAWFKFRQSVNHEADSLTAAQR